MASLTGQFWCSLKFAVLSLFFFLEICSSTSTSSHSSLKTPQIKTNHFLQHLNSLDISAIQKGESKNHDFHIKSVLQKRNQKAEIVFVCENIKGV